MKCLLLQSTILFTLFLVPIAAANEIIIADFEDASYDAGWVATGTAFGNRPSAGSNGSQKPISGFEGKGLVNTYTAKDRDRATGTLTSPEFTIDRKYINFLIGGGKHPRKTCINLLIDGKIVQTETGHDNESLRPAGWDVSEHSGKRARIEIVDNVTTGWGHINVDYIHQSNESMWVDMEITIKPQKKYLNIPVDNEQKQERVYVYLDGKIDYYLDLQLANPGEADFWVFMDIERYKGKEITLKTRRSKLTSPDAFEQFYQSDEPKEANSFYKEKNRPQFHFTSKRGWLNDSNGLVFYKGEYHLFYQHNPYGWAWGNMHWGHAVSTDLVHWKELGIALFADETGTMYSGSAVVDWNNTSGFQTGDQPPIVALYTAAGDHAPTKVARTQGAAYSNDMGRTFTKYAGNPVVDYIKGGNRDPKVVWHEESGKWIMALFIDGIQSYLLSSPDLKNWTKLSEFDGGYECPDFFPLALDDDDNNKKWVFWAPNGTYFVGSFDGTSFNPETEMKKCFQAGNAYGGQTFSDIPDSDGRRIHISWMRGGNNAFKGMPFNSQMAFPVEFKLKTVQGSPTMTAYPVKEIENLHGKKHTFTNKVLSGESNILGGTPNNMVDIYAEFEILDSDAVFGFEIRGEKFIYDCSSKEIIGKAAKVSVEPVNGKINMRFLVDTTSVEFFAADGLVCMPFYLPANEDSAAIKLLSQDGKVVLKVIEINELKSIWQ